MRQRIGSGFFVVMVLWTGIAGAGSFVTAPRLNQQSALNRQLVARWLFHPSWSGGGTVLRNLVDTRNKCTLTNMASPATSTSGWGTTLRRGGWGELRYDGVNDLADCGTHASLDMTGDFSVAAWIYLNSFGGSSLGRIIDKRGTSSTGYMLNVESGGNLALNINSATNILGQDYASSISGTLVTGVWTHIVVAVKSATLVTMSINGKVAAQDGTGALNQAVTSSSAIVFTIGNRQVDAARGFDGRIDDVCLWKRTLSVSEAREVYLDSLQQYAKTLQTAPSITFLPSITATSPRHRGRVF